MAGAKPRARRLPPRWCAKQGGPATAAPLAAVHTGQSSSSASRVSACHTACGRQKARDLVSTVIHFSTATPVHSCVMVDQLVYLNHPQAYTQDVSLAGPGLA